jgi:hypothetical protein
MENLESIKVYPIQVSSEENQAKEIARVANLSMVLGYRLEDENRVLTGDGAYLQLRPSVSLFKSILGYAEQLTRNS